MFGKRFPPPPAFAFIFFIIPFVSRHESLVTVSGDGRGVCLKQ